MCECVCVIVVKHVTQSCSQIRDFGSHTLGVGIGVDVVVVVIVIVAVICLGLSVLLGG